IRTRYQADSSRCSTLENLFRSEVSLDDRPVHGTHCLIHLTGMFHLLISCVTDHRSVPSLL
ncbi:hypothetical protein BD769DRAFT_1353065, partial [Suillus cothurnatus]